MYEIDFTTQFKKDIKLIRKQGKDERKLKQVVNSLANDIPLDKKYRDHELTGKYQGCRDCYIEPDWVLVYKKDKNILVLLLQRTGSHAEVFE